MPRKATPIDVIERIIDNADASSFLDVQLVVLLLVLLYTFSRSECPLPKSHTGEDPFDPEYHFGVADLDLAWDDALQFLKVRFRKIKQDPRVERAEAQGEGDWSFT